LVALYTPDFLLQHLSLQLIDVNWQVRPRFLSDSDFDAVAEESVRVRIFKDYVKTMKVHSM